MWVAMEAQVWSVIAIVTLKGPPPNQFMLGRARVEELDEEKWGCKIDFPGTAYWDICLELLESKGILEQQNVFVTMAGYLHGCTKKHS